MKRTGVHKSQRAKQPPPGVALLATSVPKYQVTFHTGATHLVIMVPMHILTLRQIITAL
jgi:hypothetical protein